LIAGAQTLLKHKDVLRYTIKKVEANKNNVVYHPGEKFAMLPHYCSQQLLAMQSFIIHVHIF
jgi:hypothetical protein